MTSPYKIRCAQQGMKWVRGDSAHNSVDDECTPDFSCCFPELFEQDRGKRLQTLNRWFIDNNLPTIQDA